MQILNKDLWELHDSGATVCITTNGIVNRYGRLVMGRGIALQAKNQFSELPLRLGSYVKKHGNQCFYLPDLRIISFPTKYHWKQNSEIGLIINSVRQLNDIIDKNKLDLVYLPKPGCSNGGLEWSEVKQSIEPILSNKVTVIDKQG